MDHCSLKTNFEKSSIIRFYSLFYSRLHIRCTNKGYKIHGHKGIQYVWIHATLYTKVHKATKTAWKYLSECHTTSTTLISVMNEPQTCQRRRAGRLCKRLCKCKCNYILTCETNLVIFTTFMYAINIYIMALKFMSLRIIYDSKFHITMLWKSPFRKVANSYFRASHSKKKHVSNEYLRKLVFNLTTPRSWQCN